MSKRVTKNILARLGTNPLCPICHNPVTVSDQDDMQWVKTKRGDYHFYHNYCIDKYFGKIVDTRGKRK